MIPVTVFRCPQLIQLHKQGLMNHLLKKIPYLFTPNNWFSAGSEADVFVFHNQLLKVCSAKIRYFKEFPRATAYRFQKQVNRLAPFFLPVNAIFYEDEHVMAYTQNRCQPLNTKHGVPFIAISFVQLLLFMLERNRLVSDLGAQNLGWYGDHLVVFDYHGLHPVIRKGHFCHTKWWKRPMGHLLSWLKQIATHQLIALYAELVEQCTKAKDLQTIKVLLRQCLALLMQSCTLSPPQLTVVEARNQAIAQSLRKSGSKN